MKEFFNFLRDIIDEFTDIIKEIIHPQTFFAFMFYATFCYLVLKGQPIPDTVKDVVFSLLGYWFGSKTSVVNGNKPAVYGNGVKKDGA